MSVLVLQRAFEIFGRMRPLENLDRFFDVYDRFLPRYFSEVAVGLLLFGSMALLAL